MHNIRNVINELVPTDAPFDGRWWTPEDRDVIVGGRLSLSDQTWTLTLNGWLGEWAIGLKDNPLPPSIHGSIGTLRVTLLDLVFGGQTADMTGRPFETRIYVNVILIGIHGSEHDEYSHARLRFHNLNEWAHRNPWKSTFGADDDPFKAMISYENPGELMATLPNASVVLSRSLQTQSGLGEALLRSDEWFNIEFVEPKSRTSIEWDFVRPLRYFLELAVNEACPLIGIELVPANPEHPFQSVSVLTALHRGETPENANWFRFNFNAADIDFEEILPAWCSLVVKLGSTTDLLASLRSRNFVGANFLTAATAIESYHRHSYPVEVSERHRERLSRIESALSRTDFRWLKRFISHSHEPSYGQRIDQVVKEAGEFFESAIGNRFKWRDWIVAARNGTAHRGPGMLNVDREWIVTVRVAASIQLLMSIVLMKAVGVPDQAYEERILRAGQLRFISDELRSLVPRWFAGQ